MLEQLYCPGCGTANTVWLSFSGKTPVFRCAQCDDSFTADDIEKRIATWPAALANLNEMEVVLQHPGYLRELENKLDYAATVCTDARTALLDASCATYLANDDEDNDDYDKLLADLKVVEDYYTERRARLLVRETAAYTPPESPSPQ